MMRNQPLITQLLRYVRAKGEEQGHEWVQRPDFCPKYTTAQTWYHLDLCQQAGYLERRDPEDGPNRPTWRLTWAGHEELERRNDC